MVASPFDPPPTAPLSTTGSPVAAVTSGVLVTLLVVVGIILAVVAVVFLWIRCVCMHPWVCEVRWYTHMSVLHTVLCVLYTIFLSYA